MDEHGMDIYNIDFHHYFDGRQHQFLFTWRAKARRKKSPRAAGRDPHARLKTKHQYLDLDPVFECTFQKQTKYFLPVNSPLASKRDLVNQS